MTTYHPKNEEDLLSIARELVSDLERQAEQAQVLTLSGELGSGKTTFVKAIAQVLGLNEQITSPTFTLMHSFPLTHTTFNTLYHLDLYRLSHHSEVQELGIHDLLKDPTALLLIEWPERAEEILTDVVHYQIHFSHVSPDTRRLDIYYPSETNSQS